MEIEIRMIISVCLALCASLAGTALFRIGRRQLEAMQAEDSQRGQAQDAAAGSSRAEDEQRPAVRADIVPQKLWQAGMYAGNLMVSVVLSAFYGTEILPVLRMVLLCSVLWACAWTDCRAYLIPNKILFAGLLVFLGLFAAEAVPDPGNVRYAALSSGVAAAGLLAAGLFCRIVIPGSVGFGDLKLFVVMGLYLGMDNTWNAVFYTLLASFAASVFLLVTKRASRKSVMPFAPFLLSGTLLAVFFNGV